MLAQHAQGWETAGWEIPNSARITAVMAPEVCSPSASSSRMRRRTGSPRTSKRRHAGIGAHCQI